jgi:hypothetical protein
MPMPINPYMPIYQQYQQMLQQPQIPNNGAGNFVSVPNEMAARNYPIAPGNSVTFIDENSPYCYTKTMGLNQLDRPVFKRYRLVEEQDMPQNAQNAPQASEQAQARQVIPDEIKDDINALRALYEQLRADVDDLKGGMTHGKPTVSGTADAE